MRSPRLTKKLLRWLMWRLSIPLLVLNGWCLLLIFHYFKTPITILVGGGLLAFLLEHPVQWLQRLQVRRSLAILLVIVFVFLIVGLLGLTLIPLLVKQANQLTLSLSDWAKSTEGQIEALHDWAVRQGLPLNLSRISVNLTESLANQLRALADKIPGLFTDAVGGVFESVLLVIVTIYLLAKGEGLWNGIFSWFSPQIGARVRIGLPRSFRNYFIGQGTVALLLGISMSLGLTLFRIPFGFLFGTFIGLMALFPYGGSLSIIIVTLLVCLKSFWLGITVLIIATIIDQIVESGIAPRLLGQLTGVHPVWVILALMIGGKTAGLLGFLLAVPLASFIKDLLEAYKPKSVEL